MAIAEVPLQEGEAEADVRERILSLPDRFRVEAAAGFAAEFALHIDADHYRVAIADGRCAVRDEDPAAPTARIVTDARTWLDLDGGTLTSIDAFLDDRITVRGNVDHAVRMQSLFRPFARERTPQDLEHVTIHAGGNRLSTFLFGEGPPVLLLHGLGATKLSYLPLLPALARHYTVVAPDLPGHGESTKPRADYTPQYFARVILELLDRLGADGRVDLRFVDQGPGVPEAQVSELFEPFRTEDTTGSVGLGLAIVRALAEAQGGEVSYQPNRPRGACFRVLLPRG